MKKSNTYITNKITVARPFETMALHVSKLRNSVGDLDI